MEIEMNKIEYITLKAIADEVSEWSLLAYYAHDEIQRQIYDDRVAQALLKVAAQINVMAAAKEETEQ
jgi:hypothetical protein